jgi:hypothetical protein
MLYNDSTQTIKSLFLHGKLNYEIYSICLHIFICIAVVWFFIFVFPSIAKYLKNKYMLKKNGRKWYKLFEFFLLYLKYTIPIKLILFTYN